MHAHNLPYMDMRWSKPLKHAKGIFEQLCSGSEGDAQAFKHQHIRLCAAAASCNRSS